MSVSSANSPTAASKTRYVETLTSGTSWTVPAGVTYVNAKLFGGGGGGGNAPTAAPYQSGDGSSGRVIETNVTTTPAASIAYAIGAGGGAGATGGTTTFTGATSATGGAGGAAAGAAGTAGEGADNYGKGGQDYGSAGGAGGAGQIILEYWK